MLPTHVLIAAQQFRNDYEGSDERHTRGEWQALFGTFLEKRWGVSR
jgi:hypothetical protein